MCLPSDALSQHLPSYLGFYYPGRGVCSSKAQSLLHTLDEGYLLTATPPDLGRGVAPLGCASVLSEPPCPTLCEPMKPARLLSSWNFLSKKTGTGCHFHLQWTIFCQTSPPWPAHLGWSHTAWLGFIELDKAVVHVIRLTRVLWWFQCVCPLMPSCNTYRLTWVSLTLDMGISTQPLLLTLGEAPTCSLQNWHWFMSLWKLGKSTIWWLGDSAKSYNWTPEMASQLQELILTQGYHIG